MALQSQLFAGDPVLEAVAANTARISRFQNPLGAHVERVQIALLDWDPGCLPVFGTDGRFGTETANAVSRFKIEVLGVPPFLVVRDIGPLTVRELDERRFERERSKQEPIVIPPALLKAKLAADPLLVSLPGVSATGVELREVEGELTDEFVVTVYVRTEALVSASIPEEIGGVPVEVRIGAARPCGLPPDDERFMELKGGICIGPLGGIGRGTMGAVVRDNKTQDLVGLTAAHVVRRVGDPVRQPGSNIVSSSPDDALGKVLRLDVPTAVNPATGRIEGLLDAAIFGLRAEPMTDPARQARTPTAAVAGHNSSGLDMLAKLTSTASLPVGFEVRKRGRTTGLTTGVVTGHLRCNFNRQANLWLVNQTIVTSLGNPDGRFCADGDSGAVVVDARSAKGIGLLHSEVEIRRDGVVSELETGRKGIFSSLGLVESLLDVTVAWAP